MKSFGRSKFPSASLVKEHQSPQNTIFCRTQSGTERWNGCQRRSSDLEVFPALVKTLSRDADSQIPATHLQGEVTAHSSGLFFFLKPDVECPTFGFNGCIYSGSISVGVKVHGRHHSGEGGFVGLRIQRKWQTGVIPDTQDSCTDRVYDAFRELPRHWGSAVPGILIPWPFWRNCNKDKAVNTTSSNQVIATASSHVCCVFDHYKDYLNRHGETCFLLVKPDPCSSIRPSHCWKSLMKH